MSGLWPRFAGARTSGIVKGSRSNVGTVACGIHNEGLAKSLKTFNVAETFIDIVCMAWRKPMVDANGDELEGLR